MTTMSELQRWEDRFAKPGYHFGTEPNEFLKAHAHLLKKGQTALSIADGEGRNGVWMAQQGLSVRSVDFSANGLAKAQDLAAARGVTLTTERADLAEYPWPAGAYDVVVGIFFQFAGPEFRTRVFAGIRQALRPGGLVLIQGYRPKQLEYNTGGPPHAENMYTKELMEQSFAGFEILELREHDSLMSEGGGHAGMSALLDFVARKPAA